jgi:hypothetical protein
MHRWHFLLQVGQLSFHYGPELLTERDRIEETVQRALLARRDPSDSARKIVGSVYNGGAMPRTVPAWFLTNPADFGCDETEGAGCSPRIDTTSTVPVLVLGPKVPSVGDLLPARMIGGKWVTGSGGGGGGGVISCSPCNIPAEDLTLSWSATGLGPSPIVGSMPLTFTGTDWESSCQWIPPAPFGGPGGSIGSFFNGKIVLICFGGVITFRLINYAFPPGATAPTCNTGTSEFCGTDINPGKITFVSHTCSPFHLVFNSFGTSVSCNTRGLNGTYTWTVTL